MKRSTDRILTSHTGALHMPAALQQSIVARHLGEPHDEQALDVQLREAVAGIVRRQADLGVDVVNDGEFSKSTWMGYVVERMSGVERVPTDGAPMFAASEDRTEFGQFYAELGAQTFYFEPEEMRVLGAVIASEVVCSGPLEYTGHGVLQRDIENLKAGLQGVDVEEVFLPVVGPGSVQPYIRNDHYPDDESLFAALADALRTEYRAISVSTLVSCAPVPRGDRPPGVATRESPSATRRALARSCSPSSIQEPCDEHDGGP
jgi:5-methyltetrahydropteroyltriglutamate--homocysteine methyltransferase